MIYKAIKIPTIKIMLYGACGIVVVYGLCKIVKSKFILKKRKNETILENQDTSNLKLLKEFMEKSFLSDMTSCNDCKAVNKTSDNEVDGIKIDGYNRIEKIHIIYASQTNTGMKYAKSTNKLLQLNGIKTELFDALSYRYNDLLTMKSVIIIMFLSTTGAGDAPDNGIIAEKWFEDMVNNKTFTNPLENIYYCIFGLGDRNYDFFNAFARRIDKKIKLLGAKNILPRIDSDASSDQESCFIEWKNTLLELLNNFFTFETNYLVEIKNEYIMQMVDYQTNTLQKIFTGEIFKHGSLIHQRKPYNMKNPLLSKIKLFKNVFNNNLTSRSCFHIEFDITNSSLRYLPGDHLGIYPTNCVDIVNRFGELLQIDLDQVIDMVSTDKNLPTKKPFPCPTTIRCALTHYLDINQPISRDFLVDLIPYVGQKSDRQLLERVVKPHYYVIYKKYFIDCHITLVDLLEQIPSLKPPIELILQSLPRLCCRYYSIASSQLKYPTSIHIDALLVDYTIKETFKHYFGVCTGFLSKKHINDFVPIFIRKNPSFHLPQNISTNMILIGIGTGIAPFIGFLQHRYEQLKTDNNIAKKLGKIILFYGCRSKFSEFLYQDDISFYQNQNILTQVFIAFSRDQKNKIYVNHLITEQGAYLWNLIQNNCFIYLCGDAEKLHNLLYTNIKEIFIQHASMTDDQAISYIQSLKDKHLIKSDIWK